jgi:sulfate permease, SulP family
MRMPQAQEEISLRPIKKDLAFYSKAVFTQDFWAGFAVSLLSIPQALAYSIVVGVPPSCGLIATILGTAICALLGSSRHLVVGPNNTTVLLVQGATASILYKYYRSVPEAAQTEVMLQILAALLLLIGVFQILAGVLKLGKVIQFVSYAVIVGYVLGSSFALMGEQLFTFFGIEYLGDESTLFEKLRYLVMHFTELNFPSTIVGVVSLVMLFVLKKLNFRIPASLSMLFLVTALVYAFGIENIIDHTGHHLRVIGDAGGVIEEIMPSLQFPLFDLRLLNVLVPYAFAIALISMLEATSISKSIAASSGQRLQINQGLFGLGMANFVLSFFGALPCSGSISRTVVNYEAGAKTRFAALYSAGFVAIFITFFGFLIQYIPLSALAALLVGTALSVIDPKQLKLCLRATHSDASVLIITFLSCIFFSLHIAFYIGVMLSIVLYLRKAASPHVVEYGYNDETEEFGPVSEAERQLKKKIRIINVEGELFFGAVDLFQSALKAIAEDDDGTRVFVLRIKHARDIDATAILALKQLHDYLTKRGKFLVVASIPKEGWQVLENAKLIDYIGKDNLFLLDDERASDSMIKAFERAKQLIDTEAAVISN